MLRTHSGLRLGPPTVVLVTVLGAALSYYFLTKVGDGPQLLSFALVLSIVSVAGIAILLRPLYGLVAITASLPLQQVWSDLSIPSVPLFTSIVVPLGLMTLVSTVLNIYSGKIAPIRWRVEHVLALLFVVWMFVSNPTAATSGDRIWLWTYLQLWILLVLASALLRQPRASFLLAIVFVVAAVGSVIGGWFQGEFDYSDPATFVKRLSGLQGNPSEFAVLCVVAILSLNFLRPNLSWPWQRSISVLVVPILVGGIIFSISRSGLITMFFLGALLMWLRLHARGTSVRTTVPLTMFLLGVLTFFIFSPESYRSLLFGSIFSDIIEGAGTVGLRFQIWSGAGRLWLDHPILGIGIGKFPELAADIWDYTHPFRGFAVHNSYLSILSQTGVVGFLLFLGWQIMVLRRLWRALMIEQDSGIRRHVLGLWIAILAVWMCFGFFQSVEYGKILWIAGGAGIALTSVAEPSMAIHSRKRHPSSAPPPRAADAAS